jgi:hypothetical protein
MESEEEREREEYRVPKGRCCKRREEKRKKEKAVTVLTEG